MKITIERSDLVRMLSSVERVVEARNTIPILSNILLKTTGTEFIVSATDLDIQATVTKEIECEPGSVCVAAKTLSGIAKKAGSSEMTLELVDGQMIVKSGRSRVKLSVLSSDDFPEFPDDDYDAHFDADLSSLFSATQYAISNEETRYYLTGVYLVGTDEKLEAVATNGHILSQITTDPVGSFAGVIVPHKFVGVAPEGVVKVSVSSRKIRVENKDTVLISKLIDGAFPNYERVIPKNNSYCVKFDKEAMSSSVGFVSSILVDRGRALTLDMAAGSMKISASSGSGDESTDEITADYTGEPMRVGANSALVLDTLQSLPGGVVEFHIESPSHPILVKTPGNDNRLAVIMPMRVA